MFRNRKQTMIQSYSYRSPPKIITDSLNQNNLSKDGHLFRKTLHEQDVKLLLEPHRAYSGLFLYKKYITYDNKESFLVTCSCSYGNYMCKYCEILNTSSFYDLQIPLNPEDFQVWKEFFLKKEQWTEENLYNWFSFWLQQFQNRWTKYHDKRLVFLSYNKFWDMSIYKFFYYMFQFVTSGMVFTKDPINTGPLSVDMNGGVIKPNNQSYQRKPQKPRKTKPNHVAILTGDAMIRFTYKLYKNGGRVNSIHTGRKSVIGFTYQKDVHHSAFPFQQQKQIREEKQRWKRVFQYTIDEINNEVRFRPGMCGMEECMTSFFQSAKTFY